MTHDMPAAKANAVSSRVACRGRLAVSVRSLGWQQVAFALACHWIAALTPCPTAAPATLPAPASGLHALYGDDACFEVERMRDCGSRVTLEIPYEETDRSDC